MNIKLYWFCTDYFTMFYYTAFGLIISSEIQFPELVASENKEADVKITIGVTPKLIESPNFSNTEFTITPTLFLQHIDEVAYYYAEKGEIIIVEPYKNADLKSLRIYLLCSTMSAIIHQRGMIPMHASGILTDNGVVLITGDSGAGKSTIIKALSKKGHRIFTDDVCVLQSQNGIIEGIPSYPVMKLWENTFKLLELGEIKGEDRLWPDVDKYAVYFHNEFLASWKKISKIFILEKSEDIYKPILINQSGAEAFIAIGSNTYRGWYIEPMKLSDLHFSMVNEVIKQCKVLKITRPVEGDSVSLVTELIEENL